MNWSVGKIGTINQRPTQAIGLSTPPIGCVLHLLGLPGGGNKIYDRSPYGNISTITGATWIRLPSGLWGLSFDGSDDYVDCGSDASLNFGTGAWTVALWVYFTSVGVTQFLLDKLDATPIGWDIAVTSDNVWCFRTNDGTYHEINKAGAQAGQWYYAVFKNDTTNLIAYLDTVNIGSVASHIGSITNTTDLFVGARHKWDDTTRQVLNGYITLLRIYNKALSALEIQNHFNQEKYLFGVW